MNLTKSVKIGITANAGSDIINRAVKLHFGDARTNIPARPFLTKAMELKADDITNEAKRLLILHLQGEIKTEEQLYDILGNFIADKVRETITVGASPFTPNSNKTVKLKGSSRPLVDTGRLVKSIGYEVI